MTISIKNIHEAIAGLDALEEYKEVSYNLTSNNTLSQNQPWWVFIPFGQWGNYPNVPNPSPFQNAILQTIPTVPTNECFIDIMNLSNASKTFFLDPNATQNIVNTLANYINSLPASVKPVIRYLEGNTPGASPNPAQSGIVQAFFGGNPINHQNAYFYYGNFSPEFRVKGFLRRLIDLFSSLFNRNEIRIIIEKIWQLLAIGVRRYRPELEQEINNHKQVLISWVMRFVEIMLIEPVSWNHAKIFAINGKSLVTGGANFWDSYKTNETWLFDLAMSIEGDAAIDAHKFANYFWQYLNNNRYTDKSSWCRGNSLNANISGFTDVKAPIFSDFPRNGGNTSALSIGRNDKWLLSGLGISAQVFDAIRDFILNVFTVLAETRLNKNLDLAVFAIKQLSDDDPEFRDLLGQINMSPAAWASRYARNFAISQATTSVKLSQQGCELDFLLGFNKYKELVNDINNYTGANWDGVLCSYDLLMSLSYALSNISNNNNPQKGVQIVTSFIIPDKEGYQGRIDTNKLTWMMEDMQRLGYINPADTVSNVIGNFFTNKMISNSNPPPHGNHSKLVIVDDSVCYIGSDNAYPSYNQEFGIWIDDKQSIDSFINQYWNSLWDFAKKG